MLLFDVIDGNPNGDPDAGNLPRVDPETAQGLVTDVCLKRKVRNFVALSADQEGFDGDRSRYGIFIQERGILNQQIGQAYREKGIDLSAAPLDARDGRKREKPGRGQGAEVGAARRQLCETKYDVRLFGAVMSTGPNAGQVRGPMQLTFARSVDPVAPLDITVTRMAVATEEEAAAQGGDNRTFGRKAILPYALYVARGFYSPAFGRQTGVTAEDLALFWLALEMMWELDRAAARGMMTCRGLTFSAILTRWAMPRPTSSSSAWRCIGSRGWKARAVSRITLSRLLSRRPCRPASRSPPWSRGERRGKTNRTGNRSPQNPAPWSALCVRE